MCIRDSSEAEAQANHAARIVTQQFYGVAGHTPVSYTHLDVYKRQASVRVIDRDHPQGVIAGERIVWQ
ncbi:hypothetical protein [Burkholderia plantarii]|uniref:hypothetical protein n=1 Tax=Burkholderia plantarii TaxID=41899 RepID=UPI000870773E|nr:hypothetical protein [Burkholderia plantarii]